MRRPRNKIAALPLETRLEVMQMIDDGETYESIRAALREDAISEDRIPGDSAFFAYRNGEEYLKHKTELMSWRRKAEERKAIAAALELGGGADGLLNITLYEAAEAIRSSISGGDCDTKDLARLTYALRALKTTLLDEKNSTESLEVTELKARIEKLMGSAKPGLTPETLAKIEEGGKLL